MQGFKDFIKNNNLREIRLINESFNWFGPFGRCSKLDKVLVNDSWCARDNWEVMEINRMISDHRPLLMYACKILNDPVPFRVFNWWPRE